MSFAYLPTGVAPISPNNVSQPYVVPAASHDIATNPCCLLLRFMLLQRAPNIARPAFWFVCETLFRPVAMCSICVCVCLRACVCCVCAACVLRVCCVCAACVPRVCCACAACVLRVCCVRAACFTCICVSAYDTCVRVCVSCVWVVFLRPTAVHRQPQQKTVALLQLLLPGKASGPRRQVQLQRRQAMDAEVSYQSLTCSYGYGRPSSSQRR